MICPAGIVCSSGRCREAATLIYHPGSRGTVTEYLGVVSAPDGGEARLTCPGADAPDWLLTVSDAQSHTRTTSPVRIITDPPGSLISDEYEADCVLWPTMLGQLAAPVI